MTYMQRLSLLVVAAIVGVCVAVSAPPAFALAPPTRDQVAQYEADGTLDERTEAARALGNDRPSVGLVAAAAAQVDAARGVFSLPAPPVAWQGGLPTTGAPRALAVCIDFSDYPSHTATGTIATRLDGAQNVADSAYPKESLRAFYQRSSNGALDLRVDTYGWYRATKTRAAISQTTQGREQLIADALRAYDAQGVDFSRYDNDGNGTIDYLMVFWTGPEDGWTDFWWAYQTSYTNVYTSLTLDGTQLSTYTWQWAEPTSMVGITTDAGVVIHETGHALGLPDLYDYDFDVGPDGGVGGLDMMDWDGDHNAFHKWMLGWIDPVFVNGYAGARALRPRGSSPDAVVVMPEASSDALFSEMFVVENRQIVGNDANPIGALPQTGGLLIWHVDSTLNGAGTDFAWDNSFTSHKYIALEQADGLNELESGDYVWADAGDQWTGGKAFGPSSKPNSARYAGTASKVVVDSISFNGGIGTVRAFVDTVTDSQAPITTDDADDLWHNHDVTVSFSAVDTGSGVAATYYRVDAGSMASGSSVVVTATPGGANDGAHTVRYYSVDVAGNIESQRTCTVKIDTVAPSSQVWERSFTATRQALALTASDALSGVNATYWRVDGSEWATGTALAVGDDATHTVDFFSVDHAGNAETVQELELAPDPAAQILVPSSVRNVSYRAGTIVGTLTVAGWPLPGGAVVLDRSTDGRTWALATQSKLTDATGAFSFSIAPTSRAWYRPRFVPGVNDPGQETSVTVTAMPTAKFGSIVAPTSVRSGAKFTPYGSISPRHTPGTKAVKFEFQQLKSGTYVTKKTVWAKVYDYRWYSRYKVTTTLPAKGTWYIRATHADAGHRATYSSRRKITVR